MSKYITIVLKHSDDSAVSKQLTEALAKSKVIFGDAKITAISLQDEISRIELLEDAIDRGELERARKIIHMGDSEIIAERTESSNALE